MPAPFVRLLLAFGITILLAIAVLSAVLSTLFGGGWRAMGGIALGFVGLLAFLGFRLWRRFANMTRGGDPSLRRRGVELKGRVVQVQRVPVPMQSAKGPPQTLYVVRLAVEDKAGTTRVVSGFRRLDSLQAPPQLEDEVLVYADPRNPAQIFIDWATLTTGGRRAPGSVTIEGQVLARRDNDWEPGTEISRPANDA